LRALRDGDEGAVDEQCRRCRQAEVVVVRSSDVARTDEQSELAGAGRGREGEAALAGG